MNDDDSSSKTVGGVGSYFIFLVLWAAIGYFVYGGMAGTMAMVILWILYGLATLLAMIPFAGVIVQGLVMFFVINPWVTSLTGIGGSWLTAVMFAFSIIYGIIITIVMTIFVIAASNS
jgi:hypothetical protein